MEVLRGMGQVVFCSSDYHHGAVSRVDLHGLRKLHRAQHLLHYR